MAIGLALMVGLLLVTLTVLFHYEVLQFAAGLPDRLTFSTRPRVLMVIAVVLAAHVMEALFYAVAYYAMQSYFQMGGLNGHLEGDLLDYFCFSIATYTTLGIAMYTRVAPSGWWPVLGSERACSNRLVCFVHLPDDGAILGHRARQGGSVPEDADVTEGL